MEAVGWEYRFVFDEAPHKLDLLERERPFAQKELVQCFVWFDEWSETFGEEAIRPIGSGVWEEGDGWS